MKKIVMIISSLLLTMMITAQEPSGADIDRSNWTVTTHTGTGYEYVLDTNGSGSPDKLIDGDPNSFLSLMKPGKGDYQGVEMQPADYKPGFVIDMQSSQTFNYFKWTHRLDHTGNQLRVFAIRMQVSNDGSNFTSINNDHLLWIPNSGGYVGQVSKTDEATYAIVVPESTCRYVKVIYDIWLDIYDSQHPDYPGAGAVSGYTLQVGEFALGKYDPRIMPTSDLDFGDVLRGETSKKTLRVSAISLTGGVTATLTDGDLNAFSIAQTTQATPGADGHYAFDITFTPTEKKVYNATLVLSSEGVDPVTVGLKGNAGFDLPMLISSDDNSDEHWYYIQFYRKMAANTVWSLSDTTQMIVQDTLNPAAIRPDQQWKICGNWTEGYYLVNKTRVEITYNATASENRQEDRYFRADLGDSFDFVRFGTTEDWQFYNRSYATYNPASSYKYVNDQGGKALCHYLSNDAGNRLRFISADQPAVATTVTSVTLEAPKGETVKQSLFIYGLNLTGDITASISGEDTNVFGFDGGNSTFPVSGDTLKLTFSPTEVKAYTATLILTGGEATLTIPITGNSDIGLPEFSTSEKEVWYHVQFNRRATEANGNKAWQGNGLDAQVTQVTKVDDDPKQHWKFVGTWTNLKMINREGGELAFDPANARCILVETAGEAHKFDRALSTDRWMLANLESLDGSYYHLNDYQGNTLCFYSRTDKAGNDLIFTRVSGGGSDIPSVDSNDVIIAVKYYTLQGVEVRRPATTGIYIVRNLYTSGKTKASKQLFVVK